MKNNEHQDDDAFIITVDGTHCRINKRRTQPIAQWYSNKYIKAGLAYELAIAIHSNNLVWINGPFPAVQNNLQIWRKEGGLKGKIPANKRVIADKGYQGEPQISRQNPNDTQEVKEFKKRARARHESFDGCIKKYKILEEQFCHGIAKHKAVFEAVCVIVQYQMENGHPMFDV